MNSIPSITLNDGNTIPQLGFGVFQIAPERDRRSGAFCASRSATATSTPRRCTAMKAKWAEASGMPGWAAARCSSPASSTMDITGPTTPGARSTPTLTALGSDYVDLFLIHWPLPTRYEGDFVSTWNVLEEFAKDGRARGDRGVELPGRPSAPTRRGLATPCPQSTRSSCTRTSQTSGSVPTAASIGSRRRPGHQSRKGRCSTTNSSSASPMRTAKRRHRWCCVGTSRAATSSSPSQCTASGWSRISNIFDFTLSTDQMDSISGLDRGEPGRTGPHPDTFDRIPD